MTKRNKILVSVLCACVAALLVAVCCLGFTFARYTTTETETATVGIAKWDISLTDGSSQTEEQTVSLTGVKPSADEYSNTARSSQTVVYAGTLTNSGEVAATVTSATAPITEATKTGDAGNVTDSDTYKLSDINEHITIDVYWSTTQNTNPTSTEGLTKLGDDNPITLTASSGTAYIYFDVVWTSDLGNDSDPGNDGDKFDTWMAENVATLTATVTFDVVQAADQA